MYTDENNTIINNTNTSQHNHDEYPIVKYCKSIVENVSTKPKKNFLTEIAQNSNLLDITINMIYK